MEKTIKQINKGTIVKYYLEVLLSIRNKRNRPAMSKSLAFRATNRSLWQRSSNLSNLKILWLAFKTLNKALGAHQISK